MLSVGGDKKPHAVCVPFPAQGHVTPLMQLAKLLHSRGFHITFVNTEYNHRRIIRSLGPDSVKGLPDFQFQTIPDGLPPTDGTKDVPSLCDSTRKNCLAPFRELLKVLSSSPESPPVTCVISDGVMSFGIKAAEELSIPCVQFWTASACSFMGYLHFTELIRRGFKPFEEENYRRDCDTLIDWIPGMSNIRLRDMPTFTRTTNNELMFDFMGSESQNCLNSSAIVFNTFDELERQVLEAIATKFPRIYTTGPLLLLDRCMSTAESRTLGSSLWKDESNCLEWLDKREPNSVVYVNYGSVSVMTDEHLKELAWGLANSKHPFLWIIRTNIVMGDSAILPEDFLDEISGRALLASWCPQDTVLAHPSVGVFLTHCGWNSTMETICAGVPTICWPFFADQHTNCRYACTTWGIGVGIKHDDIKRNEIESLVKEAMEGDSGKQAKQKAFEWKKKAEAAACVGGSSYNNFNRLIKEALHFG